MTASYDTCSHYNCMILDVQCKSGSSIYKKRSTICLSDVVQVNAIPIQPTKLMIRNLDSWSPDTRLWVFDALSDKAEIRITLSKYIRGGLDYLWPQMAQLVDTSRLLISQWQSACSDIVLVLCRLSTPHPQQSIHLVLVGRSFLHRSVPRSTTRQNKTLHELQIL